MLAKFLLYRIESLHPEAILQEYYTITNNRLVIRLNTVHVNEIELILPDNHRITYCINNSPPPALPVQKFRELAEAFIAEKRLNNRLSTTINDYIKRLKQFCNWLSAEAVTEQDWIDYYRTLQARLKPVSIRNHYRNLSCFADWLAQHGHIANNPLAGITPPSATKNTKPKAISVNDIKLMINAAVSLRDKAILLFFWDTGCRATEATTMRWQDIDLTNGTATVVGKGDKSRTMFFTPAITGVVMDAYRQTLPAATPNTQVFVGKRGPMTYSGLYRVFERTAIAAGVQDSKHHPHTWRHAFGRDTTIDGMPTGILQQIMGHSSIETTRIYLGFSDKELMNAHRTHSPVRGFDSIDNLIVKSNGKG